jgi:hypothetical protein
MDKKLDQNSEEVESPEFTKGFNGGWLIAKYEPQLSDMLVVSLQRDAPKELPPYFDGVKNGILHHEIEKSKQQFKDITRISPSKPDKSPDHDKGRTK